MFYSHDLDSVCFMMQKGNHISNFGAWLIGDALKNNHALNSLDMSCY